MMDVFEERSGSIKPTMAEYMDKSAFDEKFAVDPAKDTIWNIYHVQNKYFLPVASGSFRQMYEYGSHYMVHKEDYAFKKMMEPDTLLQRLEEAEPKGMVKAECRERMMDGSYRWVQYIGISGEYNGVPEGQVYFYVYDIQNQKDRQSGKLASAPRFQNRDSFTGLLESSAFIAACAQRRSKVSGVWCCAAIDIQHFKIFKAWFGEEKSAYVLARIAAGLQAMEQKENVVAAYYQSDNFGLFMPYDPQKIERMYEDIKGVIDLYSSISGFLPAIGVYVLQENEPITLDMYDRARIAVEEAKKSYIKRICLFDPGRLDRKKAEFDLLSRFQNALKQQEIGFHLQPQCRIDSGKIVGAEALARWFCADGTMIPPGTFVPLLEESGFITELDKAVWEAVCRYTRSLLDQNITPVPISINISQKDIHAMDVVSYLYGLTERYRVPTRLLKAEITESAYAENFEQISQTVSELKKKGFTVLMDDFGSGYSSLNMLDKVNADVLKLDMAFINKNDSITKKGIGIVEAIISMSKTLNIPVVIEGVETEAQTELLKNMGCRYAQGYYYYKPMSGEAFAALLTDENNVDHQGFSGRTTELFHTREFLNESLFTDTVLNNILGPVAFYTQDKNGMLNIIRFNKQFYDCIADVKMESRQTAIQNYVFEEDHPLLYKMLDDACRNLTAGGECTIRFTKSDGGLFWYNMHLFFLHENEQGKVFYGKIANATGMYRQGTAFFELLKNQSDYCLRIDLKEGLIYEISRGKPFHDPDARVMDVEKSLMITASRHIEDADERRRFVEFFDPKRLRRSLAAGIYSETFRARFRMGDHMGTTVFSAYYIKFVPEQNDSVYIFSSRE